MVMQISHTKQRFLRAPGTRFQPIQSQHTPEAFRLQPGMRRSIAGNRRPESWRLSPRSACCSAKRGRYRLAARLSAQGFFSFYRISIDRCIIPMALFGFRPARRRNRSAMFLVGDASPVLNDKLDWKLTPITTEHVHSRLFVTRHQELAVKRQYQRFRHVCGNGS